jgi:hypothetical protein
MIATGLYVTEGDGGDRCEVGPRGSLRTAVKGIPMGVLTHTQT